MSLERRVRRLQEVAGPPGVCRLCKGEGMGASITLDGPRTQWPRGCPDCGRYRLMKRIILDRENLPAFALQREGVSLVRAYWTPEARSRGCR